MFFFCLFILKINSTLFTAAAKTIKDPLLRMFLFTHFHENAKEQRFLFCVGDLSFEQCKVCILFFSAFLLLFLFSLLPILWDFRLLCIILRRFFCSFLLHNNAEKHENMKRGENNFSLYGSDAWKNSMAHLVTKSIRFVPI